MDLLDDAAAHAAVRELEGHGRSNVEHGGRPRVRRREGHLRERVAQAVLGLGDGRALFDARRRWGPQVALDGRQLLRRLLLRRQQRRIFQGRGDGCSARGALAATDDERDLLSGKEPGGFQRLARGTVEGLLHL